MKIRFKTLAILIVFCFSASYVKASDIQYVVTLHPESQTFHVEAKMPSGTSPDFVMPVWTPGYYQKMNFADYVSGFGATSATGQTLKWTKKDANTWTVSSAQGQGVILNYDVKATRDFVASSFLDEHKGYIIPGALFVYPEGQLKKPSTVQIHVIKDWTIATGLKKVATKENTYFASDFDVLYDSPLLIAPLESLGSFEVNGIPHYFTGYKLGNFDKQSFMHDLQKIVTAAVKIIGDIPYTDYTFIAIGPGRGGIEHLNSTTVSFDGKGLNNASGKTQIYDFLAHEYFHHYNVKRIRPIELGPFDYKNGSRTKMLWVSEGLSVYYEYLTVKRAGLMTEADLYHSFTSNMLAYETKPGRHYQSLVQSSYDTWSDGPFGRTEDEVNRTISYYDKGPAVGLLLDFGIRQATKNKYSLDDVMRRMYFEYYKKKKRGFTEAEFRAETEKIAGTDLSELFDYTTTTKALDYQKYLSYAGLKIDTVSKVLPKRYTGLSTQFKNDSLWVSGVDYESPAWKAGIRAKQVILKVNGQAVNASVISDLETNKQAGEQLQFVVLQGKEEKTIGLKLEERRERTFEISRKPVSSAQERAILESWLR